jgi:predicted anti-sigma-YlaC factor YlaD
MSRCPRPFDESLLSGYLDQALIQLDEQRVRVHLETCAECRATLEELAALRQAARSSRFQLPRDEQWRELPRTTASRWLRRAGWLLLALWLAASTTLGAFALREAPPWLAGLVLAGLGGLALLLASVGLDRLRDLRHDPYREIEK